MRKLIRLHFDYLFSKIVLLIIIVTLGLVIATFLISSFLAKDEYLIKMVNVLYFSSSFFVVKIISIFLFSFLTSYSFLKKNDEYSILIMTSGISRAKTFICKFCCLIAFQFVYFFLIILFYYFIGELVLKKFVFNVDNFYSFVDLFFLTIFYSNLSLVLALLINNIYVVMIPFIIFIIGSIINETINLEKESAIINIYNILFPNLYLERLYLGLDGIIISTLFLFVVNTILYNKKDLQ